MQSERHPLSSWFLRLEFTGHNFPSPSSLHSERYAEFGVGLNSNAPLGATNLEDLGRLGNCHVGIGSNFAIGRKVLTPNHIDAMYKYTTIYFDGKIVLNNGKIKI